ncbi:hypothetical protein L2E82_30439 [Cichorium intybus]|uniref:Uncharacterized protein n=1 Tax=Cichorium intybus TaxID=13427 RepID=A0ACB9D128_CICIN|nr:hypothetical protein L2E82_30439 [Cichorium intybus]
MVLLSNDSLTDGSLIRSRNQNDYEKMGLIVEFHKLLQKGDNQAMLKDEISGPVNAVVEVYDNGGSVIKESI